MTARQAAGEGRQEMAALQVGRGALRVLAGGQRQPARPALVWVVLSVLLLGAVSAATLAALPLLVAAVTVQPVIVATPAEAIAAGLGSGQPVTLTASVDDTRRVRSPQRGAAAWYAPVAGSNLLVRTRDPERFRTRPLTVTGRVTTLGALAEDPRLLSALRDGHGAPVTPETAVLVEQDLVGNALLTVLALVVSWGTALASIWLLRWEGARSPDLRVVEPEPDPEPARYREPAPGA